MPTSMVALMDTCDSNIVYGRYRVSENSERQLRSFFSRLQARGLDTVSCTVDGNPQVANVLKEIWPEIILQRCLVRIQRQGLMWCRIHPKTTLARKLREIFVQVAHIASEAERDKFLKQIAAWEDKYGRHIAKQPDRGWVFSDITRARSILIKALSNRFGT